MKQLICILWLLVYSNSICAQFGKEEKVEREKNAKLKVRIVTTFRSDYGFLNGNWVQGTEYKMNVTQINKAGFVIEEKDYNKRGTIESWTKYQLDKRGNFNAVTNMNSDGSVNSKVKVTNDYDSLGIFKGRYFLNKDSTVSSFTWFFYDSLGNMTQSDNYMQYEKAYFDSYEVYHYDKNGRTIKVEYYDNAHNLSSSVTYKYDVNGRKTEKVEDYITVYKYGPNGLLSGAIVYDATNKPLVSYKFTYEYFQ